MAIIHVTALKDLRERLVAFNWKVPSALAALEFSVLDGNCQTSRKLGVDEAKLLAAVLRPFDRNDHQYNFSQSAGSVLKTIVIQRLDSAIVMAAREARDEAQSVLDALEKV